MNYADIKQYDVANGPGIRVSVFVSGCNHQCKNCFNQIAWDFNYGKPFTEDTINLILEYMRPSYVKGLTLLGGEPFEPANQKGLLPLLSRVRKEYPEKSIWCFTGFLFDKEIMEKMYNTIPETKQMLSYIDVMVDGRFEEDKKDLSLRFKGSSNQRTILIPETLQKGEIVLWDDKQPNY